jgi:hypothetical protein
MYLDVYYSLRPTIFDVLYSLTKTNKEDKRPTLKKVAIEMYCKMKDILGEENALQSESDNYFVKKFECYNFRTGKYI